MKIGAHPKWPVEINLIKFIMNIMQRLEEYLKKIEGSCLPEIRYFNGLDGQDSKPFCLVSGNYRGKDLEESLDLFLKKRGF